MEKEDGIDPFTAQAQAWNDATKGIQRIALYVHRIERSVSKDSAKLDALQSARKAAYAKARIIERSNRLEEARARFSRTSGPITIS